MRARAGGALTGEAAVRHALRTRLTSDRKEPVETIDEFWLPLSHERADIAMVTRLLSAFEIKTERDTLRRLPRQAAAYAHVFDRCTAVVATKHLDAALDILPNWWGVTEVKVNGSVTFHETRKPQANPSVDPEVLVRLLWRDEVADALRSLGVQPSARSTRPALWTELLRAADLVRLRSIVRTALRRRAGQGPTAPSRFTQPARAD